LSNVPSRSPLVQCTGLAVVDHPKLPLEQARVWPLKRPHLLRKLWVQLTHLVRLPPSTTVSRRLGNRLGIANRRPNVLAEVGETAILIVARWRHFLDRFGVPAL
jgi:sentrin-specific protease 1